MYWELKIWIEEVYHEKRLSRDQMLAYFYNIGIPEKGLVKTNVF